MLLRMMVFASAWRPPMCCAARPVPASPWRALRAAWSCCFRALRSMVRRGISWGASRWGGCRSAVAGPPGFLCPPAPVAMSSWSSRSPTSQTSCLPQAASSAATRGAKLLRFVVLLALAAFFVPQVARALVPAIAPVHGPVNRCDLFAFGYLWRRRSAPVWRYAFPVME